MEKLHQMIDAPNLRQAFRVLGEFRVGSREKPENYETALMGELAETYGIVREITNGHALFEVFRYGYDGQNIKAAIKAKAAGDDPQRGMTSLGTVPLDEILDGLESGDMPGLPYELASAAKEAQEMLESGGDPQLSDIAIDKALLNAMFRVVHEHNNAFFQKVVRSRIDIENIRSLIRIKRAGKSAEFLEGILCEGGYVGTGELLGTYPRSISDIIRFIGATRYGAMLKSSFEGLEAGDRLTQFERKCDNYKLSFIGEAYRVVFGAEPILGYILEKENEITSVRMVMSSKIMNIPPETITERLREYEAW